MYRVISMEGTEEPWWFFEGWQDDIISIEVFESFSKALSAYKSRWLEMAASFPEFKSQADLLSAFWEPKDQIWCEECDDFQQKYHGLALLEDWHQLPSDKKNKAYQLASGNLPEKYCHNKFEGFPDELLF